MTRPPMPLSSFDVQVLMSKPLLTYSGLLEKRLLDERPLEERLLERSV
jgi:hypothetical protein